MPKFEEYTKTDGSPGLQRTLDPKNDADDAAFLSDGIRVTDERGRNRKLTPEEAEAMGVRRIVGTKNPMFVIKV